MALLDWVELRISTSHPTQWRYVQDAARTVFPRRTWVRTIGGSPSRCTLFSIRIQNPEAHQLAAFREEVCRKFGNASMISVAALELSLDFFPKAKDRDTLDQLLAHVRRHLFPNPEEITREKRGRPRAVFGIGKGRARPLDNADGCGEGFGDIYPWETLALGYRYGSRSWRVYAKTSDGRVGKHATELPPERWSARSEVTLGLDWLVEAGISTLDELLDFQFERLKKHLRFMIPTAPDFDESMPSIVRLARHWQSKERRRLLEMSGVWAVYLHEQLVGQARPVLGKRESHHRRGVGQNGYLVAYGKMNEPVREALRQLTRQFRRRKAGR